jgi:hypothetical protein
MATPQLSPGVLVREVDLTVGRADNVLDNIGAIAGPFPIGPVNYPIDIATEQDLISVFGKPQSTDNQYEYWMSASSYLSYGGVLKVVRTSGTTLNNANAGVGTTSTSLDIDNYDDYQNNHFDATNFTYAAKNPGTWSNGLKVCFIDDYADQTIGITTTNLSSFGATIGFGVTAALSNVVIPGATGTTNSFTGYLKGIITGVTTDATNSNSTIDVKIVSRVSLASTQYNTTLVTSASATAGVGTNVVFVNSVSGLNVLDTLTAPGLDNLTITGIGSTSVSLGSTISSTISSGVAVTFSRLVTIGGTETFINYAQSASYASFLTTNTIRFVNNSGINTGSSASTGVAPATVVDWYDQQTLGLTNSTIYWKSIASKPTTNQYVADRGGEGDGMHIVVVDDLGTITGNQGTLIEKHVGLSKALDAVSAVNSPQKIWYKQYLADYSSQIWAGSNPSSAADTYWGTAPRAVAFTGTSGTSFTGLTTSQGLWGQNAQGITFSAIGNKTYNLSGGVDYSATGGSAATLGDLQTSYNLFSNKDNIQVDYLIMGPGLTTKSDSQAKAQYIISLAEGRKDCVAVVGPHRTDLVGQTNNTTQTTNLIEYFSSLSSSSYTVFDSGYKYTYDRFNNKFVYVPCNADVAGLMCRTNIVSYPWFSPAGQQRGILNNAIKLAYNPSKAQRDQLYPLRINSIVTQPGVGTLLFGDKTALGYASAFDRINVRRLFLTIEQALQRAAQAQLFELNDELTRANFRNIVDPYLRDIQAKRGLYGFLVVCDTSNNTPDVIDNNEFRADIYLKPAKSINYITLTFVATRTGVSFEEVAGTV